jgi:hypothetical protein
MNCLLIAVLLGLMPVGASQAAARPLKVFILAGQSNMQRHANVSTFDSMADDPKAGYELDGFVWFQGFNDLVSTWTYDRGDQPGGYDLYGRLLADFIRDVRKDLAAPSCPL